jgi:hypothetical protein
VLSIGVGDPVRDSGLLQFVHWPITLRREGAAWPQPPIMKRPPATPDHHDEPADDPDWRHVMQRFGRWMSGHSSGPPVPRLVDGAI